MAGGVTTATSAPFLVKVAPRAAANALPVVAAEPPAPETDSISAWQASLGNATTVLRTVTTGGDVAAIQSARTTVQAALGGAVAALNERLRTAEDGAAACELLAIVTGAQEALQIASMRAVGRHAPENILTDFNARVAEAEGKWTTSGKAWGYDSAFHALVKELADHPVLATSVEGRRKTAFDGHGYRSCLAEYRRASARVQADLHHAFGIPEPGTAPLPEALAKRPLGIALNELLQRIQEAEQSGGVSKTMARYRLAFENLESQLESFPKLQRRVFDCRLRALGTDASLALEEFRRTAPGIIEGLRKQLGVLDPNQSLLPIPLPLGAFS